MLMYRHTHENLSSDVNNKVEQLKTIDETHQRKMQTAKQDHRLPKCILIGVQKCGTQAVRDFLRFLHPDIEVFPREANFFSNESRYRKGLEFYRLLMPLSFAKQITIEKSPAYFSNKNVPGQVHYMNSSIKLLLTVRNPVTRLISAYTMLLGVEKEKRSFQAAVFDDHENVNRKSMYVKTSTYHKHLTRWLLYFPREQIHIVDGENFVRDPYYELFKIETFLGIGHKISEGNIQFNSTKGFYCMAAMNVTKCLGSEKGQKHVYVPETQLMKLRTYFKPLNERFFEIAGIRFDWT